MVIQMKLSKMIPSGLVGAIALCIANSAQAGLPERCINFQPRPGLYQLECSVDANNDGLYDKRTIYKTDLVNHTWTKEVDKNADYSIDFIEKSYLDNRGMMTKREIDRDGDLIPEKIYTYEFDDQGDVQRETLIQKNQLIYDHIYNPWVFKVAKR